MSDFIEKNPFIGEDAVFHDLLASVSHYAKLDRPVLVIGERGTGKELVASRLHYLSGRWDQRFVKLNCAALADSLMEAELFGHEAGAFTGAVKRRIGRFELANRGTLFLDEIANTPMRLQEKILRVIEYGEFERVGSSAPVKVDVRVVAAANADLPTLAKKGRFRADLLDRLSFGVVTIPPLRKRNDDVLVLANHFAVKLTRELKGDFFPGFTREVERRLLDYEWPGNVRELKNVVERAVYRFFEAGRPVSDIVIDPFDSPWRPVSMEQGRGDEKTDKGGLVEKSYAIMSTPAGPYDFSEKMAHLEKELLEKALSENYYNQRRTAEYLGLTYNQLRGLVRKYSLSGGEEVDR